MRTAPILILLLCTAVHAGYHSVEDLRARGPEGLAIAINDNRPADFIDAVAAQRHASVSKLCWYTDLDKAVEAATAQSKPILSLRLLGNLTDEHSCANSRYFRTTLYASAAVSAMLRERFVLHWQSVRPVPRITIDFGDGRKIERTITGNSVHWVLDPQGRPVDALPGLYASDTFMRLLDEAGKQALQPRDALAAWHAQRSAALVAARVDAGLDAKGVPTDAEWQILAARFRGDVRFDAQVLQLVERQMPDAADAMPIAVSKARVETPMLRMVRRLGDDIALDTARNEHNLHGRIHSWFFTERAGEQSVAQLNDRVYAELFLTPPNDPWLGMAPADAFVALDGGGLRMMDKP